MNDSGQNGRCTPSPSVPAAPTPTQTDPGIEIVTEPVPSPIPEKPSLAPPTSSLPPAPVLCQDEICAYSGALFLRRPIEPPDNNLADLSYPFGSTQSGLRDPHHGVEFLNGFGTPVRAAGDGNVIVAGTDIDPTSPHGVWPITFYGPYSNFYGNLVVIEHPLPQEVLQAFPDLSGPLYTLYGHLSEIEVQVGQQVSAGQQIGKVGMAGIATGSHLHFEVRIGENTYKASRNPQLWLSPLTGPDGKPNGALAGRFIDSYGNSQEKDSIVLEYLPQGPDGPVGFQISTVTYEEKGLIGQPPFAESFGLGDLPPGLYRITFPMDGLRQELIQIFPGQITAATFRSP